jgi:hypothetical protein
MGDQFDILTVLEDYRRQLSDKILELAVANARIKVLTTVEQDDQETNDRVTIEE